VIFWEGTDRFKTKNAKALFERLQKEKYAQQFDELSGAVLSAWIEEEVRDRGGKMEKNAVRFLVSHVRSDMWRLHSLIDQLIAFKDGGMIDATDAGLFLDERQDDNIFNLVDAIVAGQSKQVFGMMREQYAQGKDPGYIFAMILRQFRILLELRDLFERDDTMKSDQMARSLDLHPFVVKKSLPLVRRYTMERLSSIYRELLEIDRETKTGAGDQSVLLDVFVGRVSALVG
jgi:DNA polymerase-3 subunit delta